VSTPSRASLPSDEYATRGTRSKQRTVRGTSSAPVGAEVPQTHPASADAEGEGFQPPAAPTANRIATGVKPSGSRPRARPRPRRPRTTSAPTPTTQAQKTAGPEAPDKSEATDERASVKAEREDSNRSASPVLAQVDEGDAKPRRYRSGQVRVRCFSLPRAFVPLHTTFDSRRRWPKRIGAVTSWMRPGRSNSQRSWRTLPMPGLHCV